MTLTKAALAIAIVTGTVLVGCETSHPGSPTLPTGAPQRGEEIEPQAGSWKTWVLSSGSQFRLPPPPDKAATDAELKELHALAGRPRPGAVDRTLVTALATPRSPSYPSEHAAVAASAARVLAYLFPDDGQALMAKAMEAARSRELAGLQYPSDTAAGLELGGKVADLVIERARHDGSEVSWSGSVPTEPGKWTTARYPSGTAPLGPLFGTYRTWVLASGRELRPGPPPSFDSGEKAAELTEVVKFPRTFPTSAAAFYWQTPRGTTTHWMLAADQKIFEYRLDANPPRAARVQALTGIATYDVAVACRDAKYTYWAMRPFHYDAQFTPLIPVPAHPSYPAAHGCHSGAAGAVLAYLFPRDAASLTAQADEAGMSRLWGGIHFPSDIRVGLALGRAVAQRVVERAKADGSRVSFWRVGRTTWHRIEIVNPDLATPLSNVRCSEP